MKTVSGVLVLGKRERESLQVVRQHLLTNLNWGEGGSFTKEDGSGEFDEKEAARANKGIEVIDFILNITS